MKIIIVEILLLVEVLLLVVLFSLAMTMRDPLPGDRNPSPPTGYTWQEWEQKVHKEFWYYFTKPESGIIISEFPDGQVGNLVG